MKISTYMYTVLLTPSHTPLHPSQSHVFTPHILTYTSSPLTPSHTPLLPSQSHVFTPHTHLFTPHTLTYTSSPPHSHAFTPHSLTAKEFGATEFVNPKDHDRPIQQVTPSHPHTLTHSWFYYHIRYKVLRHSMFMIYLEPWKFC